MSLTIGQLKFARKIGATHVHKVVDPNRGIATFYRKDGYAYIYDQWSSGWASADYMDADTSFTRIDFSPLDDYCTDKELDIVTTGGDDVPVARIITVPQDALVSALDGLARAYRTLGGLEVAFDSELLVAEALLSKIGVNR